ncbi:MAG: hypothetical protein RJA29_2849 [Pseudomonadota bacterium]
MAGALHGLSAWQATAGREGEHHILVDGFPGQKLIELLKHHDSVRARTADGLAIEVNGSLGGAQKTSHRFE